jgi:integrase/recombinase XerD
MPDPIPTPSFSMLLQRFFVEHLGRQRAVSPRTIAAYRDTFRLLLSFAEAKISKSPAVLALVDLDARLILSFLDHLEKERNNGARSRNARLAALRSFLKYAAHHDLAALHVIEHVPAIPMKRFDRPVLGFLSRQEMQAILEAPDPQTWAGQRDRTLFSLMYNTGARVSEVIGLRIGDLIINGSAAAHLSGKGRKERSVPLWPSTTGLIRGWKRRLDDLGDDKSLFPNRSVRKNGALECHSAARTGRLDSRAASSATRAPLDIASYHPPHHSDASLAVRRRHRCDRPLAGSREPGHDTHVS